MKKQFEKHLCDKCHKILQYNSALNLHELMVGFNTFFIVFMALFALSAFLALETVYVSAFMVGLFGIVVVYYNRLWRTTTAKKDYEEYLQWRRKQ